MDKGLLNEVKANFLKKEANLSMYATKSSSGIRLMKENLDDDIRPNFYHDIDRIIHSFKRD